MTPAGNEVNYSVSCCDAVKMAATQNNIRHYIRITCSTGNIRQDGIDAGMALFRGQTSCCQFFLFTFSVITEAPSQQSLCNFILHHAAGKTVLFSNRNRFHSLFYSI